MKTKLLMLCSVIALCGCANVTALKVHPDGTKEQVNLSHFFSKGSIQNFRGVFSTKTTSGLVSFSNSETETQKMQDIGEAIGAGIKKGAGVP